MLENRRFYQTEEVWAYDEGGYNRWLVAKDVRTDLYFFLQNIFYPTKSDSTPYTDKRFVLSIRQYELAALDRLLSCPPEELDQMEKTQDEKSIIGYSSLSQCVLGLVQPLELIDEMKKEKYEKSLSKMYKQMDIWHHIETFHLIRYMCVQNLATQLYTIIGETEYTVDLSTTGSLRDDYTQQFEADRLKFLVLLSKFQNAQKQGFTSIDEALNDWLNNKP